MDLQTVIEFKEQLNEMEEFFLVYILLGIVLFMLIWGIVFKLLTKTFSWKFLHRADGRVGQLASYVLLCLSVPCSVILCYQIIVGVTADYKKNYVAPYMEQLPTEQYPVADYTFNGDKENPQYEVTFVKDKLKVKKNFNLTLKSTTDDSYLIFKTLEHDLGYGFDAGEYEVVLYVKKE